jgi:hypothetical protein
MEDTIRGIVQPEVNEAKEATLEANVAASRASEATQRATQVARTAEQALIASRRESEEAKVAMAHAQQSATAAASSMAKAHLEKVEAVATKNLASIMRSSDEKTRYETVQANNKVKNILHMAGVSIHTAHLNMDHKVKEIEAGTVRRIHAMESDASRKVSEMMHATKAQEEEQMHGLQTRAYQKIQEAEDAAYARVKRADEIADRDMSHIRSENSADLKAKAQNIERIDHDTDFQVKNQEDMARDKVVHIETNKQRTIERGRIATEKNLKENKLIADKKIRLAELAAVQKERIITPQLKQVEYQAEMTIQHRNEEDCRQIKNAVNNADRLVSEKCDRYVTDSEQVAKLRSNQVAERAAVAQEALVQEEHVKEHAKMWEKQTQAAQEAFKKASSEARAAKEEAVKAYEHQAQVSREAGHNSEALAAEMSAAAAHQKARDSEAMAETAKALSQAESAMVREAQAAHGSVLAGPIGGSFGCGDSSVPGIVGAQVETNPTNCLSIDAGEAAAAPLEEAVASAAAGSGSAPM